MHLIARHWSASGLPSAFLSLLVLSATGALAQVSIDVAPSQENPRETPDGTLWSVSFSVAGTWESTCVPNPRSVSVTGSTVTIDTWWPLAAPCVLQETFFQFFTVPIDLISGEYTALVSYDGELVHTQPIAIFETDGFLLTATPDPPVEGETFRLGIHGEWPDGCVPTFGEVVQMEETLVVRALGAPCETGCPAAITEYSFETDDLGPLDPQELQVEYRVSECNGERTIGERTLEVVPRLGLPGCIEASDVLCLDGRIPGDRRFAVEVEWSTERGGLGDGRATVLDALPAGTLRGGLFWFFKKSNPEMLIKLLDGCSINGRWWAYVSAVTDVGFTVRITDTTSGQEWTTENTDRQLASPTADTDAFVCALP